MSTTPFPNTGSVIVCIDQLRREREARNDRSRNAAATDAAIIVDRIRADLVRLRRLTNAETVARFLAGRIDALSGPPESL